ncbi:MAG: RnfABCDGE type electron transport complex subunit G [Eubacteriales bacterium]|nr:RnfABCDGE type electron transport complex subunit G [Eubacteriales bacterium]
MRNVLRLGFRLLAVALVAGVLLGLTDYFTKEPIAAQRLRLSEEARLQAFEDADAFQRVDDAALSGDVTDIYIAQKDGQNAGYVVSVSPKGYGGPIAVTVGVALDGTVTGVVIGTNSETPGLGKRVGEPAFGQQYVGKGGTFSLQSGTDSAIDAVAGATVSSRAVTDGVNQALSAAQQLAQGE